MRKNLARKLLDACIGRVLIGCLLVYDLIRRLLVGVYRTPLERLEVQSILVIKLCCLGDGVLALPAIRALKTRYPAARLTMVCTPRNTEAFRGQEFIDECVELPLTGLEGLGELFRSSLGVFRKAVAAGRACHPQVAVDLDLYYKVTPILAFLSGAAIRVGFDTAGKNRAGLFTHRAPREPDKHELECFLDVLRALGITTDDRSIGLWQDPEAVRTAREKLLGAGIDPDAGYAVVAPGSSRNWPVKRWAPDRFAALGTWLTQRHGLPVVLIGAGFEAELADAIAGGIDGHSVSFAGSSSIRETIEILRSATVVVSNDSGPMHLAAAVGAPVVGIFGPTNPVKWRPWGERTRVVTAVDGCPKQPCYYLSSMPECDAADCIGRVSVEQVSDAVDELLGTE